MLKLYKKYVIIISLKNFLGGKTDFTSPAKEQPQEREISYICGLGAKVGCERLSEHSTCSDESHKYSLFLFLEASPLPAANQKFLYRITYSLYFLRSLSRQLIVIFVPSASYSVSFTVAFSLK